MRSTCSILQKLLFSTNCTFTELVKRKINLGPQGLGFITKLWKLQTVAGFCPYLKPIVIHTVVQDSSLILLIDRGAPTAAVPQPPSQSTDTLFSISFLSSEPYKQNLSSEATSLNPQLLLILQLPLKQLKHHSMIPFTSPPSLSASLLDWGFDYAACAWVGQESFPFSFKVIYYWQQILELKNIFKHKMIL